MDENQYYEILEKIYNEKKKIENSKEYKLGKKIIELRKKGIKEWKRFISSQILLKRYKKLLQPKLNSNNKKYTNYIGDKKKVVIYTCITGDYDNVYDPIIKEECKYELFTNNKNLKSDIFEIRNIPQKINIVDNNILINRYLKFHPYELYEKDYDYSIYIDGNIKIISNITSFINEINDTVGIAMHKHCARDCIYEEAKTLKLWKKGNKEYIDKQIEEYKNEGFPEKFGLAEANIIVTDLKNKNGKKIFELWWDEFQKSKSLRDQLAFPYVIWKNDIKIDCITTLGNNVYDNPKVERISHK